MRKLWHSGSSGHIRAGKLILQRSQPCKSSNPSSPTRRRSPRSGATSTPIPSSASRRSAPSDLIAEQLTAWGIPIHRGLGTTGIVAILKNGSSDRAVGLRADIDALPITEHNTFAHKSTHAGKMHACGHDGHTAMLLAAAKHLSKHRNYDGTVYLIFQPAEEGGGGAREMMNDGLFEKFPMEAIFGAHNWPGLKVGQFALRSGAVVRVEQRVQDHDPRQGIARGDAAQRDRSGAGRVPDRAARSRPSSAATSGRSTPA